MYDCAQRFTKVAKLSPKELSGQRLKKALVSRAGMPCYLLFHTDLGLPVTQMGEIVLS